MARQVRRAATEENPREVWSFFTGAMGLDLGLEEAGLGATLANEVDRTFCATIRANRPHLDLIEDDIRRLRAADLRSARRFDGDVHLMVGGPPCQPFSSGGKRAALRDPRGNLIYEYLRLIDEVKPRYFVLENVANLTTAALRHRPIELRPGKHWSLKKYDQPGFGFNDGTPALEEDELAGSALKQFVTDVDRLGYNVAFGVVDAADYGAPQHRLRFVMLGSRDKPAPRLPVPTHGVGRKPFATVREAIGALQREPGPHSRYTPPVERFFSLVPEGGNWRSLPKEIQREALGGAFESGGGKTGFFRRLAWELPAPTITGRANRKGSALCHPDETRPLSVTECAALQGFPPEWTFVGAMNSGYTQVGNAVPVPLGAAIGKALKSHEAKAAASIKPMKLADYEEMAVRAVQRLRSAGRNKRSALIAA